ncbi:MAG: hypothetical protein DMF67_12680 [Acidobacteria bacterium]|nr:MAG: hypothetical protein DMF66_11580 [Acidobacteriota bacterium]PYS82519.1 MAG: hypothetical protein DMF67_12680 [Acidobacteriota bacterium]
MRFVLFVEGDTERALPAFLKRWLDPKLPRRVGITPVRFTGWAELRREVRKRAHLHLNGPQADEIIAVIALLDLYGPDFYPAHLTDAGERYDWAKSEIEREVGHAKFRQFFAVHETEAWLLSQPELFPAEVRRGFPSRVDKPETVNFTEPPAQLLGRLYRDGLRRAYKKIVNGKELFDRTDPDIACNKCPRLKELLDEMLRLAQEALQ